MPRANASDDVRLHAQSTPRAEAICSFTDTGSIVRFSYASLHRAIARLARAFARPDGRPLVVVSACVDGVEALVVLLACARARVVACAIDFNQWPETKAREASNAAAPAVVCVATASDVANARRVVGDDVRVVVVRDVVNVDVDDFGFVDFGFDFDFGFGFDVDVDVDDDVDGARTWYYAFTSGTTGRAKISPATHVACAAFAMNKVAIEAIERSSRVVLASNATFDLYAGDARACVAVGCAAVVASRRAFQSHFQKILEMGDVTHACCTPTMFSLVTCAPEHVPSVRCVTLAGEKMSRETLKKWAGNVRLFNAYGATETTVVQTYARMTALDDPRRAGKSLTIGGFAVVYIARRMEGGKVAFIDDIGTTGEIVIGGLCVSAGYVNDVEKTAEAFVETERGRVYLTGDDGYIDADGDVFVCGRRDRQVKIRGHRTELDEIEVVLRSCELAANVAVFYDEDTHVTAHVRRPLSNENDDYDDALVATALERWASHRLPKHAVPLRYVFVPANAWPMTSSGKTDRNTLRRWLDDGTSVLYRPAYEPPSRGLETALALAWSETLGLRPDSVGALDAFDALGGTSLNVLSVSRALASHERLRLPVDVVSGFELPVDREIGLTDGEAAALLRDGDEPAACAFGVVGGPFAPCEIFARPVLRDYAEYLRANGVSAIDDGNIESVAATSALDENSGVERCFRAAVGRGSVVVVRALLASGVIPDGKSLCAAAASLAPGALHVVQALLDAGAADVCSASEAKTLATHVAAARGAAAILKVLLARGVPPGARDADKQTILHLAVRSGDIATIYVAIDRCKALKTRAGGIEAWDRWRRTAAAWALAKGDAEAVSALRDAGAKLTDLERTVADTWKHGTLSERSRVQREARPERKREASMATMSALGERLVAADGEEAASALRELVCANAMNRNAARELGMIPSLCALARDRHCVESIGALRNLAYNGHTENQTAAGESEAIEILGNIIRGGDKDADTRVVYAAASALKALCFKHEANSKRVQALGDVVARANALCGINLCG